MMRNCHIVRRARYVALVALTAIGAITVVTNGAAVAQPIETVTVTVPRMVREKVVFPPTNSVPYERISMSREVSYADLDLKKETGAKELENRIKETAKAICSEIDLLFPGTQKDTSCVDVAVRRGMKQAHDAIMAARK